MDLLFLIVFLIWLVDAISGSNSIAFIFFGIVFGIVAALHDICFAVLFGFRN